MSCRRSFLSLFSLASFADEDSWLPSFIGDAFKNDLDKADTYRSHFDYNYQKATKSKGERCESYYHRFSH